VHVFDYLQSDELSDVHGCSTGGWFSQVPPVFAKKRCVLIALKGL
jgi:hypothetical protein